MIQEGEEVSNEIGAKNLHGIYQIVKSKLTNEEVANILNTFDCSKHNHVDGPLTQVNIEPGALVIFYSNDPKKLQNWRADSYAWKNNGSNKPIPNSNPLFVKSFFNGKHKDGHYSNAWQKLAYQRCTTKEKEEIDKNGKIVKKIVHTPVEVPVLIHYFGDNKDFEIQVNATSKLLNREHNKLLSQLRMAAAPLLLNQAATFKSNQLPKTDKHVNNQMYLRSKNDRFSLDQVNSCILMSQVDFFPQLVVHAPDVRIMGCDFDLYREAKQAVLSAKFKVMLICDTFDLAGLYVTYVAFVHPFLEMATGNVSPVIPLFYFFHELKTELAYLYFFRYIHDQFNDIMTNAFVVVAHCDGSFRKTFSKVFPSVSLLHCWNSIFNCVKEWIEEKGLNKTFYKNSVKDLLLSTSKEQFDSSLAINKTTHFDEFRRVIPAWDQGFADYFNKNILADIDAIAKYSISPVCGSYFNDFNGITSNVGEGLFSFIQAMLEYKLMPIDTVVSVMQFLSIYYCNEIKRGFCNIGEYKLKAEFIGLKQNTDDLDGAIRATLCPQELKNHFNKTKDELKQFICNPVQSSSQSFSPQAFYLPTSSGESSLNDNEYDLDDGKTKEFDNDHNDSANILGSPQWSTTELYLDNEDAACGQYARHPKRKAC